MKKNGNQQYMKKRNDIDSMRDGIERKRKGKTFNSKILTRKIRDLKIVLAFCSDEKVY